MLVCIPYYVATPGYSQVDEHNDYKDPSQW